jgi:hypothetical protein
MAALRFQAKTRLEAWSGKRVLGSRKTTNGLASNLF